jgi:hypothetical protein
MTIPLFRVTRTKIVTEELTIAARDRMEAGEKGRDLDAGEERRELAEHFHEVLSILRLGPYEGHSLTDEPLPEK